MPFSIDGSVGVSFGSGRSRIFNVAGDLLAQGAQDQADLFQLQQAVQRQREESQIKSNVSRSAHDGLMAMIGNLR